MNNCYIYFKRM